MPLEIALLPMVESAFNPVALSTSRASGIWRFMPSTARISGSGRLSIAPRRDCRHRRCAHLSAAAAREIQRLAACPCRVQLGEATSRGRSRKTSRGGPADRLSEPRHARRDAQLRAQAAGGQEHHCRSRKVRTRACRRSGCAVFAVVKTTRKMDLKRAAELAEMPLDEFQYLNPHHNRPVMAGAGAHDPAAHRPR